MKKLKFIFVIMLGFLMIPFSVFAEEKEANEDTNKKVNVYFFYGNGCGYCASAKEFFASIQDEYGEYFTLVDYETWYDTDNAALMEKVAEARKESADGVPYIIIGDQSWNGYDSTYDDEIKSKIKEVYESDVNSRYDIMNYVDDVQAKDADKDKGYAQDVMVVIAMILVISGVAGGIWFARKKTA